jgi:hypothetical protein
MKKPLKFQTAITSGAQSEMIKSAIAMQHSMARYAHGLTHPLPAKILTVAAGQNLYLRIMTIAKKAKKHGLMQELNFSSLSRNLKMQ